MIWAFNLNGTLVDAKPAIDAVSISTPDIDWVKEFKKSLDKLKPLPALTVYQDADRDDECVAILTDMRKETAVMILRHLKIWPAFLVCGLDDNAKLQWLKRAPEQGVWVDTDKAFLERVRNETEWRVIDAETL